MTKFSFYPKDDKKIYYIEFHSTDSSNIIYWTLFKRQYLESAKDDIFNPVGEVHPWNLGSGRVDEPPIISMQTEEFLKKMVDALNDYEQ